jgi:hypothetical protein
VIDNIDQQCRQIIFIKMAARDPPDPNRSRISDPYNYAQLPSSFQFGLGLRPEAQRYMQFLDNLADVIKSIAVDLHLSDDARILAHKIYDIGLYSSMLAAGEIDIMEIVERIAELSGEIERVIRTSRVRDKTIELMGLVLEIGTRDLIDLIAFRETERRR